MARTIYERDTDAVLLKALQRETFLAHFMSLAWPESGARAVRISPQTPHAAHSGTIDIELTMGDGSRVLIENKVDAGYSVTRAGDPQPIRYRASVDTLAAQGIKARSVLLAPQRYLSGSRNTALFDAAISYEDLLPFALDHERTLLEAAISQAEAPYEPDPNLATADFFEQYYDFAANYAPSLVLKRNPNGQGVRPTGSNTIYVEVPKTLRLWQGMTRPRMSIQCRDSGAAAASAKIMIGDLGLRAGQLQRPAGLAAIGGYLRPAGRSLGCVLDTPRLDTQRPLHAQKREVELSLDAALRLVSWWNGSEGEILLLARKGADR